MLDWNVAERVNIRINYKEIREIWGRFKVDYSTLSVIEKFWRASLTFIGVHMFRFYITKNLLSFFVAYMHITKI